MSVLFANTSIFYSQWLHLPLSELALCVQMSVWVMCHWVRVESLLVCTMPHPPSTSGIYVLCRDVCKGLSCSSQRSTCFSLSMFWSYIVWKCTLLSNNFFFILSTSSLCPSPFFPLPPSPPSLPPLSVAAEPTGKVVNLSVSLVGSGEHEATISWSPLSSGDWNGVPYGYYVSIYTMRAFPKPTLKPYELCSRAKRHIFS